MNLKDEVKSLRKKLEELEKKIIENEKLEVCNGLKQNETPEEKALLKQKIEPDYKESSASYKDETPEVEREIQLVGKEYRKYVDPLIYPFVGQIDDFLVLKDKEGWYKVTYLVKPQDNIELKIEWMEFYRKAVSNFDVIPASLKDEIVEGVAHFGEMYWNWFLPHLKDSSEDNIELKKKFNRRFCGAGYEDYDMQKMYLGETTLADIWNFFASHLKDDNKIRRDSLDKRSK
jgi:hypothetical protein